MIKATGKIQDPAAKRREEILIRMLQQDHGQRGIPWNARADQEREPHRFDGSNATDGERNQGGEIGRDQQQQSDPETHAIPHREPHAVIERNLNRPDHSGDGKGRQHPGPDTERQQAVEKMAGLLLHKCSDMAGEFAVGGCDPGAYPFMPVDAQNQRQPGHGKSQGNQEQRPAQAPFDWHQRHTGDPEHSQNEAIQNAFRCNRRQGGRAA